MIEIQISSLVKSFEVGHNVLDGLTFQIDQGERVGLLGKNGAGKTTLFKILTGELDHDEGTVAVGQGRRLGLISQIPVYPEGYTVDDVLHTAFAQHRKLAEEMEKLIDGIADYTKQQDENAEQITHGIEQISVVVQSNVATSEASAAASEELASQASMLRELVARFRLREQ